MSERTARPAADTLQQVLRAEHAAIFGYGALGGHLAKANRKSAALAERAHRDRRDAIASLLVAAGAEPAPAEPAYELPAPVTSPVSAAKLAVLIEERTAAAWRAAVPELGSSQRRTAVDALTACAVQAAGWRRLATPTAPPTVAFPGA
jgi:hypothetical protein